VDDAAAPRYCPGCGAEVQARQAFCADCGLKQSGTQGAAVHNSIARQGERKRATVVFADIAGSTQLIDGLEIEQSARLLDPVLRAMAGIVTSHRGFVSGLRGDGIKAVFGIPMAREDHAERACAAALALRAMSRRSGIPLRIGVHSGEVLARRLHSDTHEEYDAVGLAVHLAARLEQMARPNTICISEATAGLITGRFTLRPAGRTVARGISGEVEIFELLSETALTRWSARSRAGLSRLVGRQAELRCLHALLEGEQATLGIVGSPGSGKSRLLHEVLRRKPAQRWTVLKVDVESDDRASGLRPFARALRILFRIGRRDSPAQIRGKIDERLRIIGEATVSQITVSEANALRALLDVQEASGPGNDIADAPEAMAAFTSKLAVQEPVLFVLEDAHWLDREGLRLTRLICREAVAGRLAVIVTARPQADILHDLPRILMLEPLGEAEAARLLESRLGDADEALRRTVLERAGGIPLFIEEMAKLAATQAAPGLIPDSIHAVIGERIDRLPTLARDILRIASVIGRSMPLPVLCQVTASVGVEIAPHLRLLEQGGFLFVERQSSEPEASFCHVLTREVALAGLVSADRATIHAAVLEVYESLYAQRLDEHVEKLADHAIEAGLWDKAETHLHRAAQKAIDGSRHSSAIRYLDQALEVLGRCALDEDERLVRELPLRLLLRTAYNAIGNYRQRLGNLDRAEALAERLERVDALPGLWVSRASILLQLGRVEAAVTLCEAAWGTATRQQNRDAAVAAGYMLARTRFYAGRLASSLASASRTLTFVRRHSNAERHGGGFGTSVVMLLIQATQSRAALGRLPEARESASEAVAAARASARSFDLALASYGLGVVEFYGGDPAAALSTLEEGFAASALEGAQSIHAPIAGLLAYAYHRAGRAGEAVAMARRALAHPEGSLYHVNWPRLFGAIVLEAAGMHTEALDLARRARAGARKNGYPVLLVWSELALAALSAANNPVLAMRYLNQALDESRGMGLRPCEARALFGLAALHRQAGRQSQAEDFARQGARLARTIGLAPSDRGLF
jgi:class 3 adenylate cyclase/tetratricopeptide (TPR) repeat protein